MQRCYALLSVLHIKQQIHELSYRISLTVFEIHSAPAGRLQTPAGSDASTGSGWQTSRARLVLANSQCFPRAGS